MAGDTAFRGRRVAGHMASEWVPPRRWPAHVGACGVPCRCPAPAAHGGGLSSAGLRRAVAASVRHRRPLAGNAVSGAVRRGQHYARANESGAAVRCGSAPHSYQQRPCHRIGRVATSPSIAVSLCTSPRGNGQRGRTRTAGSTRGTGSTRAPGLQTTDRSCGCCGSVGASSRARETPSGRPGTGTPAGGRQDSNSSDAMTSSCGSGCGDDVNAAEKKLVHCTWCVCTHRNSEARRYTRASRSRVNEIK